MKKPAKAKPRQRRVSSAEFFASVRGIMKKVRPGISDGLLVEIETAVRARFGGEAHYIDKNPAATKAAQLGECLARGMSVKDAFNEVGVSRSQGYRLLKRSNTRE